MGLPWTSPPSLSRPPLPPSHLCCQSAGWTPCCTAASHQPTGLHLVMPASQCHALNSNSPHLPCGDSVPTLQKGPSVPVLGSIYVHQYMMFFSSEVTSLWITGSSTSPELTQIPWLFWLGDIPGVFLLHYPSLSPWTSGWWWCCSEHWVPCLFELWFSQRRRSVMGLLGHIGGFSPRLFFFFFFFFKESHGLTLLWEVAPSSYIPTNSARRTGFPFSYILSSIYCL